MKVLKTGNRKRRISLWIVLVALIISALLSAGCSSRDSAQTGETRAAASKEGKGESGAVTEDAEGAGDGNGIIQQPAVGIGYESAEDTVIDFDALLSENPDVFAWLHIPGTDIDAPVLQSEEADDYYESHDAFGKENAEGALYTELANLKNMCDFNTVIHGKTSSDGKNGLFHDLYRFADPDFFAEHETAYLYLDGNLLTYEIFAAYERENTSLIRTYDFTYIAGCQQFLDDLYGTRSMSMNLREGWEDVTPYHFLVTLTTTKGDDPDKQYVVVAALVGDAAGTIDRVVLE